MDTVDSMPPRPLTRADCALFSKQKGVSFCVIPTPDDGDEGYAMILVTTDDGFAFGFNEPEEEWEVVKTVSRDDGSPTELQDALEEWAKEIYDDDAQNYVPDLPDINSLGKSYRGSGL